MKKENYTELELSIIELNEAYRNGNPTVSDVAFDSLMKQLEIEQPDSILLKKAIIEEAPMDRKQPLPLPMYSLNKVKSVKELLKWFHSKGVQEGDKFVITPKFDGISLVVKEQKRQCWTRGDGEVGQRSDSHYAKIKQHENEFDVTTFGEAIIPKINFEFHSRDFANARNMVAGLFNKKDPSEALVDVHYMRYGSNMENIDKSDQLFELNTMNTHAVLSALYTYKDGYNLYPEYFTLLYEVWSKDYNIDGLVIEFDSAEKRQELGREENMNPGYAVAIKLPEWSSNGVVRVTGITWKISKQGKLKPVINIEPIGLAGVTISNVTGYNAKYIFDNNVAKGSGIEITRSGDVIPKHLKTISHYTHAINDLADSLVECPCCGELTAWDETFTELICGNTDCEERTISKLVHFFSTLKVEDFGEPSIKQWYEKVK